MERFNLRNRRMALYSEHSFMATGVFRPIRRTRSKPSSYFFSRNSQSWIILCAFFRITSDPTLTSKSRAAHPLLGNKREFLPKPDLFEGWVCSADAALAAHR